MNYYQKQDIKKNSKLTWLSFGSCSICNPYRSFIRSNFQRI